jgi:hypothetical protein
MEQCNMSLHLLNQGIDMNPLFSNTRIGRYTLRNRLVMAPMTRSLRIPVIMTAHSG